jgi:tungstate transport system ATP-binding protein
MKMIGAVVRSLTRPENVILSRNPSEEITSARNVFPGIIVKIIPMGLFHKIQLDCGFSLVAYVTHQSLENMSLKEKDHIYASFKATAVHVIRKEK